jgi:twitching motility protein PilU
LNASSVLFAMEIDALLRRLASQDGSDLYLSTGAPASARFNGVLTALADQPIRPGAIATIAASIMDAEQRLEFDRELEMNLAISQAGIGRFRVNIFKQRNDVSMVVRKVKQARSRWSSTMSLDA